MRFLAMLAGALLSACAHGPKACPTACEGERLFTKAPEPVAVDREVLALCPAPPAKRVEPQVVRDFFERHLDDRRLLAALPRGLPDDQRSSWLASIWSGPAQRNAFTHVLCGDDWDRAKLGGLHLEARYAQLEQEGKVCYEGSARLGKACKDGQCLISYRATKDFSCGVKEVGGFVQGYDALDLVSTGTRAFLTCCLGKGGTIIRDQGRYKGPNGLTFKIVCGERNGAPGITTFYPVDEDPDCGP